MYHLGKHSTNALALGVLPFDQRIVDERVEDRAEALAVVAESLHGDLASGSE